MYHILRLVEFCKFGFRKKRVCTIYAGKTKALISCTVLCMCAFASRIAGLLMMRLILYNYSRIRMEACLFFIKTLLIVFVCTIQLTSSFTAVIKAELNQSNIKRTIIKSFGKQSEHKLNQEIAKGNNGKSNGDNLDMKVKTNDIRMTKKDTDYHFFATDLTLDSVKIWVTLCLFTILFVQFGLPSGHLLGNSCLLGKQFVLIVFCLFVIFIYYPFLF